MAKKKTYGEQVQDAANAQAENIRQASEQAAAASEAAAQQQIADMQAAQAEQQQQYNAAQQYYQQRMNEGYNSFADLIEGQQRQMQQEQQEAQQQVQRDHQAARWTGATELAAAIANMIGVGSANAVSQQHRTYSQNWMQKADRDLREHRGRMDNLRDRQRALQQQLAQMRMGDAGTALANARRDADQALANRTALAQLRAQSASNAAQMRAQGAEKAGAQAYQGAIQGANFGLQQASQWERQREFNAQMAAKGLNPDGTVNPDYMQRIADATKVASGSSRSSGSSSGNNYDFVVDGRRYTVRMNKETYDAGIRRGKEEIRKDVMEKAGFNGNWDDFVRASDGKSGKDYSEYKEIIRALSGGKDIDGSNKAIQDFIESNKSSMNHFNAYMIQTAGNASEYDAGTGQQTGNQGQGQSGTATGGEMSSDDFTARFGGGASSGAFNFNDEPQGPASADRFTERFAEPAPETRQDARWKQLLEERGDFFNSVTRAIDRYTSATNDASLRNAIGIGPKTGTSNLLEAGFRKQYWDDSKSDIDNFLYAAGLSKIRDYMDEQDLEALEEVIKKRS